MRCRKICLIILSISLIEVHLEKHSGLFDLRTEGMYIHRYANRSYLMAIQNRAKVEVTGQITRRLPFSPWWRRILESRATRHLNARSRHACREFYLSGLHVFRARSFLATSATLSVYSRSCYFNQVFVYLRNVILSGSTRASLEG